MDITESVEIFCLNKSDRNITMAKQDRYRGSGYRISERITGCSMPVEALILIRIFVTRASGSHIMFNREFVKPGIFPKIMTNNLRKLFDTGRRAIMG